MQIPIGKIVFHGNEREYVAQAMADARISSQGPFVERFEAEFATYVGTRFAVSTCNGTAALHLMLVALGIGETLQHHIWENYDTDKMDEVIVPALTFPATANMVQLAGANPVLCDVDPNTWTLDAREAEIRLNERTRATIPVSLYGCPANMDSLRTNVDAVKYGGRGWSLLEDGAQGLGARARYSLIGNLAHATTFSFYGNKTLTCGEGGMVTTNDEALANKMRLLRAHGEDPARKFWFPKLGFNYRMSNLHAAVGCAQLERIEAVIRRRNEIAAGYKTRLQALIAAGRLGIQEVGPMDRHAYWLFSVVLENSKRPGKDRDDLRYELGLEGIETRPIFYPLHLFPMYHQPHGTFPVAEHIGLNGLSLPTFEDITDAEQDYVCERLIHHMEAIRL